MGRDLAGAHVTATEVLAATAGVAVGIEVLDSRYTDYRFTMPDVVADNASAGRYVVGTPVPPAGIDLRLVGVVLEHNGERRRAPPRAPPRWATRPRRSPGWSARWPARGEGLRAGDVILSGGLTAAVPVVAGRRRRRHRRPDRLGGARVPLTRVPLGARDGRERWTVEPRRPVLPRARPRRPARRHRRALPAQAEPAGARACSATAAWSAPGTGTPSTSPTGACRTAAETDLPLHPVVEVDGMLYAEVNVEPQLSWSERLRAHAATRQEGDSRSAAGHDCDLDLPRATSTPRPRARARSRSGTSTIQNRRAPSPPGRAAGHMAPALARRRPGHAAGSRPSARDPVPC